MRQNRPGVSIAEGEIPPIVNCSFTWAAWFTISSHTQFRNFSEVKIVFVFSVPRKIRNSTVSFGRRLIQLYRLWLHSSFAYSRSFIGDPSYPYRAAQCAACSGVLRLNRRIWSQFCSKKYRSRAMAASCVSSLSPKELRFTWTCSPQVSVMWLRYPNATARRQSCAHGMWCR